MLIKKVHVRNFRSIEDGGINCEALTALVGRNGSGKSTLLRALELFFAPNPKVDQRDFYAEDTSRRIEIEATFTSLRHEERQKFVRYLHDDDLTVIRILSLADGQAGNSYHGLRLSNPDFAACRSTKVAREIQARYDELRESERYSALPAARSREDRLTALDNWEDANPDSCSRQIDQGQFFGFTEVAQGYLGRYTKFISIPAVRDASFDAEEGRGSAITEILNLVVRSSLESHQEIQELRESANQRYRDIIDPSRLSEMTRLEVNLTSTLRTFVPDTSVHLNWLSGGGIDIQMPKADVLLTEDGYRASVARTGHGLQRAFILTMLQHLAFTQISRTESSDSQVQSEDVSRPDQRDGSFDLILAIEEPELYQHPTRQRHLATVLFQLASGDSPVSQVTRLTQVMYSTHSPAFVGLDRFNQIRLFRKRATNGASPKVTSITASSLGEVARTLWEKHGRPGRQFTEETLRPRLRSLMTPWMNEGFFADLVVLVEGEEDRAAILGTAMMMGHDFDRLGISVIPCGGKQSLDRPALIFDALGIPVYLVWDCDQGENDPKPEMNRCLLRIVEAVEEDYPHAITSRYGCFTTKLMDTMRNEIGDEIFIQINKTLRAELSIQEGRDDIKNPFFVQTLVERARLQGGMSSSLEAIVNRIIEPR
jgi:putative ATP-dependent endonuclease of OLD family